MARYTSSSSIWRNVLRGHSGLYIGFRDLINYHVEPDSQILATGGRSHSGLEPMTGMLLSRSS